MTTKSRRLPLRVAAVLAASFIVACESSDVIAPDGATITLSATPSQIVLSGGIQTAPVTVLATVFNQIGVPLPGQDVRFTTSSGVLDPPGGTPVKTDDFGNATTILTQATTGPQINARSGKVTATPLTLNAATGILSSILLNVTPDATIDLCTDSFTVTATASDPDGDPIRGVTIVFGFGQTGATFVIGNYSTTQGISDITGKVTTTLNLVEQDCIDKCSGKSCDGIEIKAQDQSGTVISPVVPIRDTGSN
jgi:Bacterial Ig-like domain (group 1)